MKYLRLVRIYTIGNLGYFMVQHTPWWNIGSKLQRWAFSI